VSEDRLSGIGPKIPIRVVVIPATGPGRSLDPIVWFAGGPGDSAVEWIGRVAGLFFFNSRRDLVFIDQRGTGGAGALSCPNFMYTSEGSALEARVTTCLRHLDADLRFYTTDLFADDVDQILGELGYTSVNVVGISYGATSAQVFTLRHPDRVRTMTLLSGTLLTIPVLERFPQSAQQAIETVFAECARQSSCHQAFPHLQTDWSAMWASLEKAAWVVHSPTGTATITVTADMLAGDLHELMAEPKSEAWLPVIVHALSSASDKGAALLAVAAATTRAGVTLQAATSQIMIQYPIRCNEAWARDEPGGLLDKGSFEYHLDLTEAQWWKHVCSLFPSPPPAAVGVQARASSLPVLALNGEADPQDPPSNMKGARSIWSDSLELAVPGQTHDIDWPTWHDCTGPLVGSFIARASVAGLDSACVGTAHGEPFALSLNALAAG
jgi:pimeloyl-ACP methyl ester carboxylesterase